MNLVSFRGLLRLVSFIYFLELNGIFPLRGIAPQQVYFPEKPHLVLLDLKQGWLFRMTLPLVCSWVFLENYVQIPRYELSTENVMQVGQLFADHSNV